MTLARESAYRAGNRSASGSEVSRQSEALDWASGAVGRAILLSRRLEARCVPGANRKGRAAARQRVLRAVKQALPAARANQNTPMSGLDLDCDHLGRSDAELVASICNDLGAAARLAGARLRCAGSSPAAASLCARGFSQPDRQIPPDDLDDELGW